MKSDSIHAILLAAGLSRRMGEKNKLLLPWEGQPMIRRVAAQLLEAGAGVSVVLGHEADLVRATLSDRAVHFVENSDYLSGMTSSIQAGVKALPDDAEAFMVCPGDMPWLTAAHYRALMTFFREKKKEDPAPIVRPVVEGEQGHPVVFDASYAMQILACQAREGCREVIWQNQGHFYPYSSADRAFIKDMDK